MNFKIKKLSSYDNDDMLSFQEWRLNSLKNDGVNSFYTYSDWKNRGLEDFIKYFNAYYSGDSNNFFAGIFDEDNKLVGGGGVVRFDTNKTHILYIQTVYVREEFRGLGLGSKLIEFILDNANLSGIKKYQLEVLKERKAAFNLYKKFGFKKIGIKKEDICFGGKYYDMVVMEKYL